MSLELQEIGNRLRILEHRIEHACARVGRDRGSVTLMAVSKKQDIKRLQSYIDIISDQNKIAVIGESYVQEFRDKKHLLTGQYESHLIGALQKNKIKDSVRLFDVIEGVHSIELAREIDKEAGKQGKLQRVFIQVNISGDENKRGFSINESVVFFSEEMQRLSNLQVRGLMTITRLYDNAEQARPDYTAMRELREEIEIVKRPRNHFRLLLSMGMSDDFEVAIEEGADIIRIGTALFGDRKRSTG